MPLHRQCIPVTERQFYDWQTAGGGGDVLRLVEVLERLEIPWCMIDGLAVNYWAEEPMATADVDVIIAAERVEDAVDALIEAGFQAKRHDSLAKTRQSLSLVKGLNLTSYGRAPDDMQHLCTKDSPFAILVEGVAI
jgi:hypothetical protein